MVNDATYLRNHRSRGLDPQTQAGITQALVSATAAETDAFLVSAFTAGSSVGSNAPADLFAAVSGGSPRRPVLIAGLDTILALAPGVVRDLQALGIQIATTPAASAYMIAVDAAGLLISDGDVMVETSRHASMAFDDGGSPQSETLVSLWQSNLACLRAERYLRIAFRAGAVAYANVGSPA